MLFFPSNGRAGKRGISTQGGTLPSRRSSQRRKLGLLESLEQRSMLTVTFSGLPNWVPEGPAPNTNAQDRNIPTNPVSGAIEAIAVDPADGNTVYVGGANGGVWKTTNESAASPTWTPLTDQFPSLQISSLQFDPTDTTNQTVVAGIGGTTNSAGFSIGSFGGQTVGALTGLLKTTDGGTTWTELGDTPGASGGLQGQSVSAVGARGGTILAATQSGLFLTTNGGASFVNISGTAGLTAGPVFDLAADSSNNSRFYAVVGGGTPGVFRTDNLGGAWTNVSNAAITTVLSTNIKNAKLSVSAAAPNPVYLAIVDNTNQLAGVFSSANLGSAWTAMDLPQTLDAPRTITNATNTSPIVITTSANDGYSNGDKVRISGVTGNTAANGDFTISVNSATPNQFTLVGSTGNGNYAGSGTSNNIQGILHGRQAFPNLTLYADPGLANIVYIAGDRQDYLGGDSSIGAVAFTARIFRGNSSVVPGGTTAVPSPQWTPLTDSGTSNNSSPHADSRAMIFDSNNLLYSCDGGIFQENSPHDATGQWLSLNGNLQVTQFFNISYDSIFHVIMGGAQDTGTPAQTGNGSFTYSDQTQADGPGTLIDNFPGAGSSQSVRYIGQTRRVFSSATATVGPDVGYFPTGGLTGLTSLGAVALNAIAPPAGQSTRLVISGTAPPAATGTVYESTNAGIAATTAAITWIQVPTGTGFVSANAIAAGGQLLGVNNPDVLYVASGSQIFLRSTAGGTLNPTAGRPSGSGTITNIALDPTNWKTAFVTDNNNVFMTTDAGGTWTNETGNLTNSVFRLGTQLAVIAGTSADAVFFGGFNGVEEMLTSAPGVWTKFGAGLPNVLASGIQYNAADNVLIAGTYGRGGWEIPNASAVAFSTGVLTITGDTNYANEDDIIKLIRDPANTSILDVYLNSTTPVFQVPLAIVNQINVFGLGGNDTLIVDSSNGLITVPNGIRYDGGTGSNSLQLVQTGGVAQTSDVYGVSLTNPGSGSDVIIGPSGTQTVDFQNLAPTFDNVPSPLIVNGTAANDIINYSQGATTSEGLVTINNSEPIDFTNKTSLTLQAVAGDDTITVNNPNTPTALTAITVDGGIGNDTLVVNANGQAVTTAAVTSTTVNLPLQLPVTYLNIEQIHIINSTDALTNLAVPVFAQEATFASGLLVGSFNFSDVVPPTLFANAEDFTAQINWGDLTATSAGTIVSVGTNGFQVYGSHTYAAAGAYTITVAVTDKGSSRGFTPAGGTAQVTISANPGATTSITSPATVADAPLTTQGAAISGIEGLPLAAGGVLVATFSDLDSNVPPTNYSASINWGDGSITPATLITASGSPNGVVFSVYGQHTYREAGTYSVQVEINDLGGSQTVAHAQSVIADAPLAALASQPTVTTTERIAATPIIASFNDANPFATTADFTSGGGSLIVDWGDGSPAVRTVLISQPGGPGTPFLVAATHTYSDSGSTGGTGTFGHYSITLHVRDTDGASLNVTNTANVMDLSIPFQGRLNPLTDSGVSHTDAITNINQPNFYGTTEAYSHVFLYATLVGGGPITLIGQTEAASDGSWSVTTNRLADGNYTITATVIDQFNKTVVTVPASPIQILPNATQGYLVIDTVGPKITNLFFDHLHGRVDVTFQDERSGLVQSTMVDAANYSFNKQHERLPGTYNVNVLSVSAGGPIDARQIVATINRGRPIKGGFYKFTVYAASVLKTSGIQDVAGNPLDGEFYGFFPSGNNVPGGDFIARIDAVHNRILPPTTIVGRATPVFPPGTLPQTVFTHGFGKTGKSIPSNRSALTAFNTRTDHLRHVAFQQLQMPLDVHKRALRSVSLARKA